MMMQSDLEGIASSVARIETVLQSSVKEREHMQKKNDGCFSRIEQLLRELKLAQMLQEKSQAQHISAIGGLKRAMCSKNEQVVGQNASALPIQKDTSAFLQSPSQAEDTLSQRSNMQHEKQETLTSVSIPKQLAELSHGIKQLNIGDKLEELNSGLKNGHKRVDENLASTTSAVHTLAKCVHESLEQQQTVATGMQDICVRLEDVHAVSQGGGDDVKAIQSSLLQLRQELGLLCNTVKASMLARASSTESTMYASREVTYESQQSNPGAKFLQVNGVSQQHGASSSSPSRRQESQQSDATVLGAIDRVARHLIQNGDSRSFV
jgi:hypothetical protein